MRKNDSSHLPKRKNKIKPKPPYNGGQGGPDGEMGDTWTGNLPGSGTGAPCWTYAEDWPEARPGVHFFDMTCGDGPARMAEKQSTRECGDYCYDCSAVSCDDSCIVYPSPEHYPWWGASTSSTTGQAHCGCSPHCGCANEQEYCGSTYNCYYAVCTNGTFHLINCQGDPCDSCAGGYENCWDVWGLFQDYYGQDGLYPNAGDYAACGFQGTAEFPTGTMTSCYCDVCS